MTLDYTSESQLAFRSVTKCLLESQLNIILLHDMIS